MLHSQLTNIIHNVKHFAQPLNMSTILIPNDILSRISGFYEVNLSKINCLSNEIDYNHLESIITSYRNARTLRSMINNMKTAASLYLQRHTHVVPYERLKNVLEIKQLRILFQLYTC